MEVVKEVVLAIVHGVVIFWVGILLVFVVALILAWDEARRDRKKRGRGKQHTDREENGQNGTD